MYGDDRQWLACVTEGLAVTRCCTVGLGFTWLAQNKAQVVTLCVMFGFTANVNSVHLYLEYIFNCLINTKNVHFKCLLKDLCNHSFKQSFGGQIILQ